RTGVKGYRWPDSAASRLPEPGGKALGTKATRLSTGDAGLFRSGVPAGGPGTPRPRVSEPPVDPSGRQRRRKEVALPHLASQLDERDALLDTFDAFRHGLELERLPQPDDRSEERRV